MSIWCSGDHIGTDPTVKYEVAEGVYEIDLGEGTTARGREPVEQHPEGGNVLSYADGFSNHYPDLTGSHERPAAISTAWIPPWCVPGHRDDDLDETDALGPWLRLEVAAPQTLDFWRQDEEGNPTVREDGATVVLDEAAVRSLVADLTAWLERSKVQPEQP